MTTPSIPMITTFVTTSTTTPTPVILNRAINAELFFLLFLAFDGPYTPPAKSSESGVPSSYVTPESARESAKALLLKVPVY
jgi:hypothetical protein